MAGSVAVRYHTGQSGSCHLRCSRNRQSRPRADQIDGAAGLRRLTLGPANRHGADHEMAHRTAQHDRDNIKAVLADSVTVAEAAIA
jgi:hypothetical protein